MSMASRVGRLTLGVIGMLLALGCTWGAWRATQGERLYRRVKFGDLRQADHRQREQVLQQAFVWRPSHYNLCTLAAEMQWHARQDPVAGSNALARCRVWTERGLALNPLMPQLRIQHARLLAEEDPFVAAEYWEGVVAEHYWNPYNQAVLCDFYARAGRIEQATLVLARIRGREHHAWASDQLRLAIDREMARSPFNEQ